MTAAAPARGAAEACGEPRGYHRHYREGSDPCRACMDAHNDWMRDYRTRMYLAGGPLTVDATGTRRRLQALARIGHSYEVIAAECGVVRSSVQQWASNRRVTRATAARVTDVYDRWSMTVGPSSKSRARAQAAGWPPPLAWDDDAIDDPSAEPRLGDADAVLFDEVAVERAVAGERVHLRPVERREAIGRLTALGLTATQIAARLDTTKRAVERHRATARATTDSTAAAAA